jgi:hypothetical protein
VRVLGAKTHEPKEKEKKTRATHWAARGRALPKTPNKIGSFENEITKEGLEDSPSCLVAEVAELDNESDCRCLLFSMYARRGEGEKVGSGTHLPALIYPPSETAGLTVVQGLVLPTCGQRQGRCSRRHNPGARAYQVVRLIPLLPSLFKLLLSRRSVLGPPVHHYDNFHHPLFTCCLLLQIIAPNNSQMHLALGYSGRSYARSIIIATLPLPVS